MSFNFEIFNSVVPFVPKVLAATLCGAIIGLEREIKKKAAGLRTMILICTGCTLMTIVAYKISPSADPSRMIEWLESQLLLLYGLLLQLG